MLPTYKSIVLLFLLLLFTAITIYSTKINTVDLKINSVVKNHISESQKEADSTEHLHSKLDKGILDILLISNLEETVPEYSDFQPNNTSNEVSLHRRNLRSGWNWISFPKLPRDAETNEPVNFLQVANTLNPYGLQFQYISDTAVFYEFDWVNYHYNILSTYGYKVEMSQNMQHSIEGTTLNPNTIISLYSNRENWIGYFLPETIDFKDAFGEDVLNSITSIKSQN